MAAPRTNCGSSRSGCKFRSRRRRAGSARCRATIRWRSGLVSRGGALSRQSRGAAGRRAAGARRALRRPHLVVVDPRLLLHHSADQADPRRHRSGGDRAQLSGGARADGGRAHLPAPDAGRARPPQGQSASTRARARNGSRPSTAIARSGTRWSRPASRTTRARSIRSAPRTRSTARCRRTRSSSATSACTTTGCCSSASRSVPIH